MVWSLCGKACRKGVVTLPAQEVSSEGGHHLLRKGLAMVSTWQKAISPALTRMDVATQTELPQKAKAIQFSGSVECQSLSLVTDGSSESSCVRCYQVDDLLSLVAESQEEVERLRSIRNSEKKVDWWNHALPSLRQLPEKNLKILYLPPVRLKAVD